LQKAAIKGSAKEILFDGADVPLGKMPDFQRTIPTAKALHPDTLLAYEMNGQTLPFQHGFPLRVITPGWASDSWVKWLQHIEVLDHEFDGFWMKSAYRHPTHPVPPGTAVDPSEMIPVTALNVKSVIAVPVGWAKPGPVRVQGTAWSNTSPVSKVDVSTDGGQTWKRAKLTGQQTKYGWRIWQHDWKAAEGSYTLISRATNMAGQTVRNGIRPAIYGTWRSQSPLPSRRRRLLSPKPHRQLPRHLIRMATRQPALVATMST
jgi:DMSO/TMAO reductase YedYZ molybdopterin-dependent catalytic subunit